MKILNLLKKISIRVVPTEDGWINICFLGIRICSYRPKNIIGDKNSGFLSLAKSQLKNIKNYNFYNFKKIPNFENKLKRLVKNLPEESTKTVSRILKRIDVVSNENGVFDYYSDEEKQQIKASTESMSNIIKIRDNLFFYNGYFLPIGKFETSVFYYKNGMNLLDNPDYFKNKAIVDVGAFVGDSALILSPFTNDKVYCFEAISQNYNLLKKTIELNELKNVLPVKYALGSKAESLEISIGEGSASNSSFISTADNSKKKEICEIITLDSYVEENNLKVGLIKVDIEGFEQEFIKGAINTIKTQRPSMLLSIYHNINDFLEIKPIIEDLNLGYKFKIYRAPARGIFSETLLICEI